jgi:hypothetical protein
MAIKLRTTAGIRVTLECRKGFEGPAIRAALRQSLALVEAELAGD